LSAPVTTRSAYLATAAWAVPGAALVVSTIVRALSGDVVSSGLSSSRSRPRVSTAIGVVGGRPALSSGQASFGVIGRYFSARAVPAPTMITSARLRRMENTCRSPSLDSPADRPATVAAPSALDTMLARTQGRPASGG